jgi:hypothetical protein
MTGRGGKRLGAGRKPKVSSDTRLAIGAACEKIATTSRDEATNKKLVNIRNRRFKGLSDAYAEINARNLRQSPHGNLRPHIVKGAEDDEHQHPTEASEIATEALLEIRRIFKPIFPR